MPFVSKSAYEKFEVAFKSAPNFLTKVLRSHHAIEAELHGSLGMYLTLSPRLDLRKIPFLTKVDLLISLSALNPIFFPFFAEVNRLRNRFAHDPDAELAEEDQIKIKNLYSSCVTDLAPKNWEMNTPARAVGAIFQTVYLAARSSYEQVVNARIQSRALDHYIAQESPSINNPSPTKFRLEIDTKVAEIAKALLETEHPDVNFRDLYALHELKETDEQAGSVISEVE